MSAPSTLSDKAQVAIRATAAVVTAIPTTSFPPLLVTQALSRRFRDEERLQKLHHMAAWARFVTRHVVKPDLEVSGLEHLPRPSKGHMYVSNHQSYADIMVLGSVLGTLAFLSKSLVRKIPFVGRAAAAAGTIFFDRRAKDAREKALQETLRMCKESTAVVVFPEGTRSEDGSLREKTHPRALYEAHFHGIRLVPLAIYGTHRILPKTMDRFNTGEKVSVRIGEAFDPKDFETPEAYATACWRRVAELHAEARIVVDGSRP